MELEKEIIVSEGSDFVRQNWYQICVYCLGNELFRKRETVNNIHESI